MLAKELKWLNRHAMRVGAEVKRLRKDMNTIELNSMRRTQGDKARRLSELSQALRGIGNKLEARKKVLSAVKARREVVRRLERLTVGYSAEWSGYAVPVEDLELLEDIDLSCNDQWGDTCHDTWKQRDYCDAFFNRTGVMGDRMEAMTIYSDYGLAPWLVTKQMCEEFQWTCYIHVEDAKEVYMALGGLGMARKGTFVGGWRSCDEQKAWRQPVPVVARRMFYQTDRKSVV